MSNASNPQWMMPGSSPSMRIVSDDFDPTTTVKAVVEGDEMSSMTVSFERRQHRRFDVESMGVSIERWDGRRDSKLVFGKVIDMSAGGVRLRTRQPGVRADQQIRVRLELPDNGGICPFIEAADGQMQPKREWVGWLAVARVTQIGDAFDIAGRLVDMEEMDRGMLGLYLSTQPLAA